MSVSLKKTEKVDLSKPELSRKLPEFTPIHLIDEEETIVNRSPAVVHSDVRLEGKLQSDEIVSDSTPKKIDEIRSHDRKRIIIGIVLSAVTVFVIFLVWLNFPSDFFQELSKAFENSQDIYGILSFIASNPIVILLLVISFVGFALHLIYKVCSTFIRR